MSSLQAAFYIWAAWAVSWLLAAFWARPAAARPSFAAEASHRIPTVIGYLLAFYGAGLAGRGAWQQWADMPLWRLPSWLGWALTALAALGFAFTWWARVTLGALWSGDVSRKADHKVIDTGPYRLVRHPIYTGILVATYATTAQIGAPSTLAGIALVTLAFWIKGRLEERFLAQELGEAAYEPYRRRTPMLVPFWPARG